MGEVAGGGRFFFFERERERVAAVDASLAIIHYKKPIWVATWRVPNNKGSFSAWDWDAGHCLSS
jgi:hypothetical protein